MTVVWEMNRVPDCPSSTSNGDQQAFAAHRKVFDSGVKQSPIPAISRRSLRGGEELARDLVEEEEEERRKKEEKKEGAVEKMKRLLRVDSDETDDLHDKYRLHHQVEPGQGVLWTLT